MKNTLQPNSKRIAATNVFREAHMILNQHPMFSYISKTLLPGIDITQPQMIHKSYGY